MLRALAIAAATWLLLVASAGGADWTTQFLANEPVKHGSFELLTGDDVLQEARVIAPATFQAGGSFASFILPLARGQRTPARIGDLSRMTWQFDGELRWRSGPRRLKIDRWRVTTSDRRLTARVGRSRMTVGILDKSWMTAWTVAEEGRGYWPASSQGPIRLSRKFRLAFRRNIGRTPPRRIEGSISLAIPVKPDPSR